MGSEPHRSTSRALFADNVTARALQPIAAERSFEMGYSKGLCEDEFLHAKRWEKKLENCPSSSSCLRNDGVLCCVLEKPSAAKAES